jgi:outer membrane protein
MGMRQRIILTVLCLGFLLVHLFNYPLEAATAGGKQEKKRLRLSLNQALELAVKNNYQLKTARRTLINAASNFRSTKAGYFPTVSGNLQAAHGFSASPVSDPWVVNQFSSGLNITFNMPLDLSGSIGRSVQQSLISLITAKGNYVLAGTTLMVTVYSQYYNLMQNRETIAIDQANVAASEQQLHIAQARLKAGRVPEVDVLTATVQLDNARQTLKSDEGNYETSKAALRNTLIIKQNVDIIPTEKVTFTPETFQYDSSVKEAEKSRVEMQAARLSLESAKIALKSTYDPYLPTMSVGGSWGYNTAGRNPDEAFRANIRPLEPSWVVTASLNIPIFIFDGGKNKEQKIQAVNNIEQAEANLLQQRDAIDQEVKTQLINLNIAQDRVKIVQGSIKLARESLRITELRYRMGLTGYLEVTDARNNLRNAEVNLLGAIISHNNAKVLMYKALGRPMITDEIGAEKK